MQADQKYILSYSICYLYLYSFYDIHLSEKHGSKYAFQIIFKSKYKNNLFVISENDGRNI